MDDAGIFIKKSDIRGGVNPVADGRTVDFEVELKTVYMLAVAEPLGGAEI